MFVKLIRDLKIKVKETNRVVKVLIFTNLLTFGAFCIEAELVDRYREDYNGLVDKVVEISEHKASAKEEKIDIPEEKMEEPVETKKEETKNNTKKENDKMDNTAKTMNLSVESKEVWIDIPVTSNSSVKSYMDGSAITYVGSDAYEVKSGLYIREDGLYTDGKYIGIAISEYYGKPGDKFRITLDSGNQFYAIMTDTKKSHELNERLEHPDGSLIEFVIDIRTAQYCYPTAIAMGDFNYSKAYSGGVVKIERLEA